MLSRTPGSNGSTSGGVTSIWFGGFDGTSPTLEMDGTAATDVSHRYLWSPASGELLSDEIVTTTSSAGTIQWALGDQVGTVRDIARWNSGNSEFEVANHRVYSSFGEFESETNSAIDLTFGFTGQWTDPETGYTFHLNRWYDPRVGKWLGEDPIGFSAGDTNLSRYVTNRALTHIDPMGLDEGLGREVPNTGTGGGADPLRGDYGDPNDEQLKKLQDALNREIENRDGPPPDWTDGDPKALEEWKREADARVEMAENDLKHYRNKAELAKEHKQLRKQALEDPIDNAETLRKAQQRGRTFAETTDKSDQLAKQAAEKIADEPRGWFSKLVERARKKAKILLPPGIGLVFSAEGMPRKAEAKGPVGAVVDEVYDNTPVLEWFKFAYEVVTGDDLVPDLDDVQHTPYEAPYSKRLDPRYNPTLPQDPGRPKW